MAKRSGITLRFRGKADQAVFDAFAASVDEPRRACRYCSCTDLQACPGACTWTGDALCSACTPDIEQTITALCLVSGTEHITDDQVKAWTADQRADAFYWAMAVHYVASDNEVSVPQRPICTEVSGV